MSSSATSKSALLEATYINLERSIMALAATLCLLLAIYNTKSNDPHLQVSRLIENAIETGTSAPTRESCFQCYHPKLFHFAVTILIKINFQNLIDIRTLTNLMNFGLWCAVNIILSTLIRERLKFGPLRLAAVGFCWLSPSVIGIGAQATNDALVMLFGSIAPRFISWPKLRLRFYIWASTVLAVFSKGSALVVLVAVLVQSVMKAFKISASETPRKHIAFAVAASLFFLAISATPLFLPERASPYSEIFQKSLQVGQLQGLNFQPQKWPPFFNDESNCQVRPANICSIFDGFLRFRLLSLLECPKVPRSENAVPPKHLSSVPTAVYARYFLPFFPQHVWKDESQFIDEISRILAILGLFPLVVFLLGAAVSVRRENCGRRLFDSFCEGSSAFHLFIVVGLVSMLVLFNLSYQWNPGFKDIYLFCGIFSFWYIFLDGLQKVQSNLPFTKAVTAALVLINLLWFVCLIRMIDVSS